MDEILNGKEVAKLVRKEVKEKVEIILGNDFSKISKKGFEPERVSDDDRYFFIPKNKIKLFKACIA